METNFRNGRAALRCSLTVEDAQQRVPANPFLIKIIYKNRLK
jgi:hypothetical protein